MMKNHQFTPNSHPLHGGGAHGLEGDWRQAALARWLSRLGASPRTGTDRPRPSSGGRRSWGVPAPAHPWRWTTPRRAQSPGRRRGAGGPCCSGPPPRPRPHPRAALTGSFVRRGAPTGGPRAPPCRPSCPNPRCVTARVQGGGDDEGPAAFAALLRLRAHVPLQVLLEDAGRFPTAGETPDVARPLSRLAPRRLRVCPRPRPRRGPRGPARAWWRSHPWRGSIGSVAHAAWWARWRRRPRSSPGQCPSRRAPPASGRRRPVPRRLRPWRPSGGTAWAGGFGWTSRTRPSLPRCECAWAGAARCPAQLLLLLLARRARLGMERAGLAGGVATGGLAGAGAGCCTVGTGALFGRTWLRPRHPARGVRRSTRSWPPARASGTPSLRAACPSRPWWDEEEGAPRGRGPARGQTVAAVHRAHQRRRPAQVRHAGDEQRVLPSTLRARVRGRAGGATMPSTTARPRPQGLDGAVERAWCMGTCSGAQPARSPR